MLPLSRTHGGLQLRKITWSRNVELFAELRRRRLCFSALTIFCLLESPSATAAAAAAAAPTTMHFYCCCCQSSSWLLLVLDSTTRLID
jgi:hypothetical protein